jgi:hypothetical protein
MEGPERAMDDDDADSTDSLLLAYLTPDPPAEKVAKNKSLDTDSLLLSYLTPDPPAEKVAENESSVASDAESNDVSTNGLH